MEAILVDEYTASLNYGLTSGSARYVSKRSRWYKVRDLSSVDVRVVHEAKWRSRLGMGAKQQRSRKSGGFLRPLLTQPDPLGILEP